MDAPKLVLTDIDGVWTDGGMYYGEDGQELKKFHTGDGAGVALLRAVGIPVGILTGENLTLVRRRAEKLGIGIVLSGVGDKLAAAEDLCRIHGLAMDEIAYIGDDLIDMELLSSVRWSATPSTSPEYVRRSAHWRMELGGGMGVFREFAERILEEAGMLEHAVKNWKKGLPGR